MSTGGAIGVPKGTAADGTSEGSVDHAELALGIPAGEPTATVWQYIVPTTENYPGTEIPRSFNISTPNGTFWTHGNTMEHRYEAVRSLKGDPMLANTNPALVYGMNAINSNVLAVGNGSGFGHETIMEYPDIKSKILHLVHFFGMEHTWTSQGPGTSTSSSTAGKTA